MGKSRYRKASRGWNKYRKHTGSELTHRHSKKVYDTVKSWSVLYPESIKRYIREYTEKENIQHLHQQILENVEKQIEDLAQYAMKQLNMTEEEREESGLRRLKLT